MTSSEITHLKTNLLVDNIYFANSSAIHAAFAAAPVGGIIAAVLSGVRNYVLVKHELLTRRDAMLNIAKDSVKGMVATAAVTYCTTFVGVVWPFMGDCISVVGAGVVGLQCWRVWVWYLGIRGSGEDKEVLMEEGRGGGNKVARYACFCE